MTTSADLMVILRAQDQASRALKGTNTQLGQLRASAKQLAIGFGVATAAGTGLVLGVKSLTDAALEQQKAEKLLQTAVENSGASYADFEQRALEATAALQRKTNFGDEVQIKALARLTQITGDAEFALKALPTVLDAAASSGSSLETVAGTLGRALSGQANTAESLGLTFDATASASERLAEAQRVAAGAAAAASDPWTQLGNDVGDMKESIGELLLPAVETALPKVRELAQAAGEAATEFGHLASEVGNSLQSLDDLAHQVGIANEEMGTFEGLARGLARQQTLTARVVREAGRLYLEAEERLRTYGVEVDEATEGLNEYKITADQVAAVNRNMQKAQQRVNDTVVESTKQFAEWTDASIEATRRTSGLEREYALMVRGVGEAVDAVDEMTEAQRRLNEILDRGTQSAQEQQQKFQALLNVAGPFADQILQQLISGQINLEQAINLANIAVDAQRERLEGLRDSANEANEALNNLNRPNPDIVGGISETQIVPEFGKSLSNIRAEIETVRKAVQFNLDKATRFRERASVRDFPDPFLNTARQAQAAAESLRGRLPELEAERMAIRSALRTGSFQTAVGETRRIPGAANQPVPIMAHGGEVIGRPRGGKIEVHIHGDVFGLDDLERRVAQAVLRMRAMGSDV